MNDLATATIKSVAHPIDAGIFAAFLMANLILGIYAGRSNENLRDYAVGKKNFSTGVVTSTIIATWISGEFLFYALANIYTRGLLFIIPIMGLGLCLLFKGQMLAVRMGEFLNNLSVAEAMGDLYGEIIRVVTGVCSILASAGRIAIQFKIIGKMLALMLDVQGPSVTVIAAAIVILYSTFGGIRSVTITDVFQFLTFSMFIPILALTIWHDLKSPAKVTEMLNTNPIFSLRHNVGWNIDFFSALALMLYYIIPGIQPAIFQRIVIARNVKQVRDAFTYAALATLCIVCMVVWLAILLRTDDPNIDPQSLVQHIVHRYSYIGLKGLVAAGITAMAMSTADSYLNPSAVIIANDIIKPLRPSFNVSLTAVRVSSVLLGVAALLMALQATDLLEIILLSGSVYMPIVTVPLLLAIFGFRSRRTPVLVGMAAGFVAVVVWRVYFIHTGINSIIPGMVANLVVLMISHYLLRSEGGWVGIKEPGPLQELRSARRKAWGGFFEGLRNFHLYTYLVNNLPSTERPYTLIGFYIIGATYALFFTIPTAVVHTYPMQYRYAVHTVLVFMAVFVTYSAWPTKYKRKEFMAFFWPLGMGYVFFVMGGLLVVMSGFHQVQVLIFILNMLVVAILLDWPLVLFLLAGGFLMAWALLQCVSVKPDLHEVAQFRAIYGVPFFVGLLITLFRNRWAYNKLKKSKEALEAEQKALELRNKQLEILKKDTAEALLVAARDGANFAGAFREAGVSRLNEYAGISRELKAWAMTAEIPQHVKENIYTLEQGLIPLAVHLDRLDHKATGYLLLKVKDIAVEDLIQGIKDELELRGLTQNLTLENRTSHKTLQCDVDRIKKVFVNSVLFLQGVRLPGISIRIALEDTRLKYAIPVVQEDYTRSINAVRFLVTFGDLTAAEKSYDAQVDRADTAVPSRTQDTYLAANRRIVLAHYGYESAVLEKGVYNLCYVVPVKLREVRPKDMDISQMELGTDLVRADDNYPGAQEQEIALIEALGERAKVDMGKVYSALEIIKRYHGETKRKTGEPFYLHPVTVAHIALDYNQDEATMLSALLHDTVEDTRMLQENIEVMFGPEVSRIVQGVTHLNGNTQTLHKVSLSTPENFLMLLGVKDKRVLHVKVADRMHNMRTIHGKPLHRQLATAKETLQFYVPLADRLGLHAAAEEFKTLCFAVLSKEGQGEQK